MLGEWRRCCEKKNSWFLRRRYEGNRKTPSNLNPKKTNNDHLNYGYLHNCSKEIQLPVLTMIAKRYTNERKMKTVSVREYSEWTTSTHF